MYNVATYQGYFTSDGTKKILSLPAGCDFIEVRNLTQSAGTNNGSVSFFWQLGMPDSSAIRTYKTGGTAALNMDQITTGGFHLFNSSVYDLGPRTALSAISNANPPVITVASTSSLSSGQVVRFENITGAQQFGGYDFSINVLNGTTFNIAFNGSIAAATSGWYRVVNSDVPWYPRWRFIDSISQATQASVHTTVPHGYTVGQIIRFTVPEIFSMTQINSRQATVVDVVDDHTFLVDVNSTGFTAFTFPTTAQALNAFSPAIVGPVGEDTAAAIQAQTNILADATRNATLRGVELPGGLNNPGGSDGDLMYWIVGVSMTNN